MKTTHRRMTRILLALLAGMVLALPEAAMSGYIKDPAFGDDGVQLIEIGNFDDRGYAVARQPDGRIVVAGMSETGATAEVAVVRLTPAGALDTTFSSDGRGTYAMGRSDSSAADVAIAADGSILIVGTYRDDVEGSDKPAVMRLTGSGIVDISFGPEGSGITTLAEAGAGRALAVDAEQRILVAGTLEREGQKRLFAARLLADGRLDSSFGEGGLQLLPSAEAAQAAFIATLEDGGIVIGGSLQGEDASKGVAYRLDDRGRIVKSYGKQGRAVVAVEGGDIAFSAGALSGDGTLVAAGYQEKAEQKSILTVKIGPSGELASDYGESGKALLDIGYAAAANDIALLEDGTSVVVGESAADNGDMVLIHLDGAGRPVNETVLRAAAAETDAEAAGSDDYGIEAAQEGAAPLRLDIGGENNSGRSLVLGEDGRIVVAGFASNGVHDDIAVLAFTGNVPPEVSGETDITKIPYLLATMDISAVSRTGAMSGGVISENPQFACAGSADPDSCRPTVAERGVVYAVVPYPSYQSSGDSNDTTGSTGSTGTGGGSDSASVFPSWVDNSSHISTVVRRGQTSNGSGKGAYGSDITEITPETTYYVRAYARLSDETVVYGNQVAFKSEAACFIATAAYGSPLQAQVRVLQQFRDEYLATNEAGRAFVRLYYHFSPPAAEFISRSALLRLAVRIMLLPFVAFSSFMVTFTLQVKLLLISAVTILLFMTKIRFARR